MVVLRYLKVEIFNVALQTFNKGTDFMRETGSRLAHLGVAKMSQVRQIFFSLYDEKFRRSTNELKENQK